MDVPTLESPKGKVKGENLVGMEQFAVEVAKAAIGDPQLRGRRYPSRCDRG